MDGRSNNSSSTDISRMTGALSIDIPSDNADHNRTHHLLKHCLSNGQRTEALAHFGTDDIKEAAKEISKMGQRDLQSKFRLVYGTATHSNNNDWLRRKLYEAIGAAPIKAATKAKPRKAASKPRKTLCAASAAAAASAADHMYHHHHGSSNALTAAELADRRSSQRRLTSATMLKASGVTAADMLKRYRMGTGSMPGSPMVGRSVLDIHRYLGHDSTTTSASEDDAETWEDGDASGEDDGAAYRHRASSDIPGGSARPYSAFAARAAHGQLPAVPPHLRATTGGGGGIAPPSLMLARRASSAGLGMSINLDMFQAASDVWGSDAWADAALKAAAARKAPAVMPSVEDEDVMMLPMDLSAFEDDAAALL